MRFASNSCLCFGRFCGSRHASRSGGSISSFRRLVSLSLSFSAWLVLTEDLTHHRVLHVQLAGFNSFGLPPAQWNARGSSVVPGNTMPDASLRRFGLQFLSVPAGPKHGSFRRRSWCCIGSCLTYPLSGAARASGQEHCTVGRLQPPLALVLDPRISSHADTA